MMSLLEQVCMPLQCTASLCSTYLSLMLGFNEADQYCVGLQKAEMNWQFDMFSLAEATPGNTLSLLAFHLINRAGFIQQFNLDEGKLCRFLQRVEKGYDASNPYHNRYACHTLLLLFTIFLQLWTDAAYANQLHTALPCSSRAQAQMSPQPLWMFCLPQCKPVQFALHICILACSDCLKITAVSVVCMCYPMYGDMSGCAAPMWPVCFK